MVGNAFEEIFAAKQFLSIREAAQYLNVEYKTLYRLVVAGKIPASRVGGVYRIKRQDIDDYLEGQKGTARPAMFQVGSDVIVS